MLATLLPSIDEAVGKNSHPQGQNDYTRPSLRPGVGQPTVTKHNPTEQERTSNITERDEDFFGGVGLTPNLGSIDEGVGKNSHLHVQNDYPPALHS